MIFIMIELLVLPRTYPSRSSSFIGMGILMAIYLGWVFCIKANAGYWVYPILKVLDWPQRIGFFAFCVAVPFGLYFVGPVLNYIRWGSAVQETKAQKKKKQKSK
jgi:FAR-17a/AIG1-like protein